MNQIVGHEISNNTLEFGCLLLASFFHHHDIVHANLLVLLEFFLLSPDCFHL